MNNILNYFSNISISSMVGASGDSDSSLWVWGWLDNLIGKTGGETVHWLTNILVIGLILYIDAVQFIRFLQNMSNRNSSDMQAKAIARDNIKSCIMIIVVVTVIGAGGYVALGFFMNMIMTKAGIM